MSDLSRRTLLGATLAAAGAGPARAEAHPSVAVRVEREPQVLDPAFRTGLQDGNIIRAIGQRLLSTMPDGNTTPDAAKELKQEDPTTLSFTLKEGQMFTDDYGEMTAEDVKFSFERFAVAAADGKKSPYAGDWANLGLVEITGKYTGRIHMDKPRAGLIAVAVADVSGTIVSRRAVEERGAEYGRRPVGSGKLTVGASTGSGG